jgi:hypothetical protein
MVRHNCTLVVRAAKSTLALVSAIMAIAAFAPHSGQSADHSAYASAWYAPTETHVESITVAELDPSWTRVLVLRRSNQPADVLKEVETLGEPYGARFEVTRDFNNDGNVDRAVVGVYQDAHGQFGQFLLIITRDGDGSWRKAFLHVMPGRPGFSILYDWPQSTAGPALLYSECMACDVFAVVVWADGQYRLQWSVGPCGAKPCW